MISSTPQIVIRYRVIGFLAILFFLWVIFFVAKAIYDDVHRTIYTLKVELPQVGTLEPQNAVYYRGVSVGMVAAIEINDQKAIALLSLDEPLKLRQGTKLVSKTNGGVLGGRYIYIEPSEVGEYLADSALLKADFEPSIVESMHKLQEIMKIVYEVSDLMRGIQGLKPGVPSFKSQFWNLSNQIYTLIQGANEQIGSLQGPLFLGLGKIDQLSTHAIQLSNQTDEDLKKIYAFQKTLLPSIDSMIFQVNHIALSSNQVLDSLEANPAFKSLTTNKDFLMSMHKMSDQVARLVEAIRSGEVVPGMGNDPLIQMHNVHLFRKTAHEELSREKNNEKK